MRGPRGRCRMVMGLTGRPMLPTEGFLGNKTLLRSTWLLRDCNDGGGGSDGGGSDREGLRLLG